MAILYKSDYHTDLKKRLIDYISENLMKAKDQEPSVGTSSPRS